MGTAESQHGRSCGDHDCCGTVLGCIGSHFCFRKAQFVWRDGKEEDVLEVYFLQDSLHTCKVGYLAKHLAFCAN